MTAAAADGDHHGDADSTGTTEAADPASESDHDDSSNALAITALVVGGVALLFSVVALVRRPRAGV